MIAQLRSELRKMRTTRTNLGLFLGMIGLILLTILVGGLTSDRFDLSEVDSQKELFGNGTVASVFVALIGIMAMTSEFRHGTIRATFVFTPVRNRVVAAKVLASLLMGIAFGAFGQALAFGAGYAVIRGKGVEFALGAGDVRLIVLGTIGMSALWAAIGVGVGAVVRNQVFAILGLSVWAFLVENVLTNFLPGVARYAPGSASSAMTGDTTGLGSMHLLTPAAGVLLLTAYAAAFTLAGAVVTNRRDVG